MLPGSCRTMVVVTFTNDIVQLHSPFCLEFQMYVKRSFESLKLWARSINEKMEDLAQQKERLNVADMEEYEAIENEFSLPLKSLDELSDMERRINTSSERHKLVCVQCECQVIYTVLTFVFILDGSIGPFR